MSWEYDPQICDIVQDVKGSWHCVTHKQHYSKCKGSFGI